MVATRGRLGYVLVEVRTAELGAQAGVQHRLRLLPQPLLEGKLPVRQVGAPLVVALLVVAVGRLGGPPPAYTGHAQEHLDASQTQAAHELAHEPRAIRQLLVVPIAVLILGIREDRAPKASRKA